jgi:TolA-binding protein
MKTMSNEIKQLQKQMNQLEERVNELEQRLNGSKEPEADEGIREFVESLNPSSHTKRALGVAYYLETYRNKEVFTVGDIEEGYRDCRTKPASNMSDVLGRMEDRDWLLRDGKEGQTQLWRLTATALETIEEEINDDT